MQKHTLRKNTSDLTGVQNLSKSSPHYQLRRYFPSKKLEGLVEQYWLVNWHLADGEIHSQKNLPDANFHLVVENKQTKIIAPVSKSYQYEMTGKGEVIGIKFAIGALNQFLPFACGQHVEHFIDQELTLSQLNLPSELAASINDEQLLKQLEITNSDEEIVAILETFLSPLAPKVEHKIPHDTPSEGNDALAEVRRLIQLIKNDEQINTVDVLASKSPWSVRTMQRYFKQFVGLSPKWLIRKYRLHQALALLEQQQVDFLDIVDWLGYTDQSHLIRDFKEIIGVTPSKYLKQ